MWPRETDADIMINYLRDIRDELRQLNKQLESRQIWTYTLDEHGNWQANVTKVPDAPVQP